LTLTRSTIPDLTLLHRGKVRETYAVGADRLLLVATDRLSAFDVVFEQPIPDKGRLLTALSAYWFRRLQPLGPTHFLSTDADQLPESARTPELSGRVTLARRAVRIDAECVVRGYLAGSGWAEYRASGTVGGHHLPGYSLLFPPLGSLFGARLVGLIAVALSAVLFADLMRRHYGTRLYWAVAWFALGKEGVRGCLRPRRGSGPRTSLVGDLEHPGELSSRDVERLDHLCRRLLRDVRDRRHDLAVGHQLRVTVNGERLELGCRRAEIDHGSDGGQLDH